MKRRWLRLLRRGSPVLPWRTLLLAGLALALYLLAGPAPEALVYDRTAIGQGEWWRLLSGHWVHADGSHAGWDILGLLCLGLLFEARLGRLLPLALLAGTAAVDLWLLAGSGLARYCGLSGILNALLVAGLAAWWRELRSPVIPLVAAGALVKIMVELGAGEALFTRTLWPSVPMAHGAGFAAGALLVLIRLWWLKAATGAQAQRTGYRAGPR
jgi:rhomboid family GlyGly-CTERM serine protease